MIPLLFTGAPGSGKSTRILETIRPALAALQNVRLLVPTATMAEHVRNTLAREGLVFSPDHVTTLSKYLESFAQGTRLISPAALNLLIARLLETRVYPEFRAVARFRGFRTSLAALISEISTAGCTPQHVESVAASPEQKAFRTLYADVEREVRDLGMVLRAGLLEQATRNLATSGVPQSAIALDGFFSFGARELEFLGELARHTRVTLTLPDWEGARGSRRALLAAAFQEERCTISVPSPQKNLVIPATLDGEAEEIARRVIEAHQQGVAFGQIGVVLRGPGPHLEALRTALDRFGIPSRFYFTQRLAAHSSVRFFTALIRALLGGWVWVDLLAALRIRGAGDGLDFELRKRLPGQGLAGVRDLLPDTWTAPLERVEEWAGATHTAAGWGRRLGVELPRMFSPAPPEPGSMADVEIARAHAAALASFREVLEETASALGPETVLGLEKFWSAASDLLEDSELRTNDHRWNMVHVMDAYEARQWRLPVVFVAGLLERQFPRYHPQDSILPDETRLKLRRLGIELRTAADREQEERFLFELATTRATRELHLSYPKFNSKGEENLASFFLRDVEAAKVPARRVRPAPGRPFAPSHEAAIYAPDLLEFLARRHTKMGPTTVEKYLACPFQFFAEKTLALAEPPAAPHERLDNLLSGTIVHAVLEKIAQNPGERLEAIFEAEFAQHCREARVPEGFRRESIRLDMLRDLEIGVPKMPRLPGWQSHGEHDFSMDLGDGLTIVGQMDRYDLDGSGRVLVIDYKYSGNAKQYRTGSEDGSRVQAGLYLLAARQDLKLTPAGMLFVTLRRGIHVDGWHLSLPGLEKRGEACVPEVLEHYMREARDRTLTMIGQLRSGRIDPAPGIARKCYYCEYAEVCRSEATPVIRIAGGEA